jgi:predicted GNAT family acetyltransferase
MKPTIKNKSNDIIEICLEDKSSYIRLQKLQDNTYCVITTFVDPAHRGKGLGNVLYEEMIKFIRENKTQFKATCPYVVDKAKEDKKNKDIYLS